MAQITIPLPDLSVSAVTDPIGNFVKGKRGYFMLAVGVVVIVANHYGVLPPGYAPGLDPSQWIQQIFLLLTASGGIADVIHHVKQSKSTAQQ